MLNSKSIGEKIASARKSTHLSQAELAQQVSISPQAVGKWERGESMPDITTLHRLAELLGVDLNYFSENFPSAAGDRSLLENSGAKPAESTNGQKERAGWDMSQLNLTDSDFSGLNNLHEKLSNSNIQRCLFVGAEMSGLVLKNNHVDNCLFPNSDLSHSHFQNSMLHRNDFKNCSLKNTKFSRSFVEGCDFTGADLTETEFKSGGFGKNTLTHARLHGTSFVEMGIQEVVFEGTLEECRFENCTFYGVKFQNATFLNTFFKNNKRIRRVQFTDCKADKLTYAFLKNNLADLTGITLVS